MLIFVAVILFGITSANDKCYDCSPADCIPITLTRLCHNQWVRDSCPDSCGICSKIGGSSIQPKCKVDQTVCSSLTHDDCVYTLIQKTCPDLCSKHIVKTTTTQAPPTTLKSATKERRICHVCESPFCDLNFEAVDICVEWKPYCMNYIKIDVLGRKTIQKRCVSEAECNYEWLNKTANLNECRYFDNNKVYTTPLNCQFCCKTDKCNRNTVPHFSTMKLDP